MTPINERKVKVSAFQNSINEALQYGSIVIFTGSGEVVRIIGDNNQDGTQDITYSVKVKVSEIKVSDTEISIPKVVSTEVQREKSLSQSLRNKCFAVATKHGLNPDSLYKSAIDTANQYVDNLDADYSMKGLV